MKALIRKRGQWIALGLFGLGAVVFTLLEITLPGLILLLGAFLVGVYTIASPEQLSGEGPAVDDPPPAARDTPAAGSDTPPPPAP